MKSGATRHVLLLGGYAIKVPRLTSWRLFLHGLLANMQEEQWRGFSPRLCPIRLAVPGGWLLVMTKAYPLDDPEWQRLRDDANFLFHNGARLPVEWKRDSFGTIAGHVVAVDYGS